MALEEIARREELVELIAWMLLQPRVSADQTELLRRVCRIAGWPGLILDDLGLETSKVQLLANGDIAITVPSRGRWVIKVTEERR